MLWFKGSVSEAIAESKRIRSIFVVYVTGDDEESKKMDAVLDSDEISATCSRDCTAIKLNVNSVEGKQFASIYPVVCVPCTYFINGEGTPIEVIGGSLPAQQFIEKTNETIQKHRIKFPILRTDDSSSSSSQSIPTDDEPQVQDGSASSSNMAERVDRAKMLIERKRRETEEKEKAEVQRKEIERRKQGQEMSKAKGEKEDKLAQQMADRVRLEKAKEKAAREAVREKIAQDKAERAARQEIEKKEKLNAAIRIDPNLSANDPTVKCFDVRIQFRLRDGSSVTQSFPADATLETARDFICSKTNLSDRITFWTTFPRKHLGADDFPKTLTELGLSPSAALVVDPTSESSSNDAGDSSAVSSMISLILAPFIALLSFVKLLLFGSPPQRYGAENTRRTADYAQPSSSTSPNSDVRRRQPGKSEDAFKKDGKIHSFRQEDNDDDENNTWNGNSTQQM